MTKTGAQLIARERERQISQEGFSINSDVQAYACDELLQAAAFYMATAGQFEIGLIDVTWPWPPEWFKPGKLPLNHEDRRRCYVKAGALIAAHIDLIEAVDKLNRREGFSKP